MDDASLDDFLDAGSDGTDGERVDAEGGADGGETTEPEGTGAVEPATTTYQYAPGSVCAACGGTVDRRWQGEAGLVCPDCKEW